MNWKILVVYLSKFVVVYCCCCCCLLLLFIVVVVRVCLDQLISFKARLTILQEVANEIKDKLERKKNEESN